MKKSTILEFIFLSILGFQIIQNPDDYDKIILFLSTTITIVKEIEEKRIRKE